MCISFKGVHYQPSSEPGVASGQGPGQGQGGKGDSMYNHNSNSVTEKEGYIKPLTAAAIMSTTATRVRFTYVIMYLCVNIRGLIHRA